ncbi:hypothetical protein [Planomonospora algeriensis]
MIVLLSGGEAASGLAGAVDCGRVGLAAITVRVNEAVGRHGGDREDPDRRKPPVTCALTPHADSC